MAAEALIVEDAYQKGYADAMEDMRKKKEQRRQQEQEKKARRWYFIKQKAYGFVMLAVTVLAVWATEGDITIAVITVPLGLMCLFGKKMLIVDNYYFEAKKKQRIKKCSLQKKYGVAGMDGGACLGFSYDGDDEPIERCKRCIACTSFDWEEEKERLKL